MPEDLKVARKRIREVSKHMGWTSSLDLQLHYSFNGMAEFTALGEEIAMRRAREAEGYNTDSGEETQCEDSNNRKPYTSKKPSSLKAPSSPKAHIAPPSEGGEQAHSESNVLLAAAESDKLQQLGEPLPYPSARKADESLAQECQFLAIVQAKFVM
ncbi:hypothetical protein VTO73DRAFT_7111 [Trametes versicolor]